MKALDLVFAAVAIVSIFQGRTQVTIVVLLCAIWSELLSRR